MSEKGSKKKKYVSKKGIRLRRKKAKTPKETPTS